MSETHKLRYVAVVSLVCAVVFVILCSYRGSAMPDRAYDTRDAASLVAESFIKNDETFRFDGIADTLSLRVEHAGGLDGPIAPDRLMMTALTLPLEQKEYTFKAKFDSRHTGYGDRTGKYLAQAITPHEAEITVINYKVTRAIMDGKWDMVQEKIIE